MHREIAHRAFHEYDAVREARLECALALLDAIFIRQVHHRVEDAIARSLKDSHQNNSEF
jgi:hypothetical protein